MCGIVAMGDHRPTLSKSFIDTCIAMSQEQVLAVRNGYRHKLSHLSVTSCHFGCIYLVLLNAILLSSETVSVHDLVRNDLHSLLYLSDRHLEPI
jgi:hypothetical protein